MKLLCLDTSTDYAVCAVGDENGELLGGVAERHERNLSVRLYGFIDAALAGAGVSFDEIDSLAVGIGPGSFTGVRVAVTTMRTLAQVTGKPLVAVGTLDAMARDARAKQRRSRGLCVLLPSRRNEAYAATYDTSIEPLPVTASYTQVRQFADRCQDHLTYCGSEGLLSLIFPERLDPAAEPSVDFVAVEHPSAAALLLLAGEEVRQSRFRNSLSLDPMYIAAPAVSQHKNLTVAT